MGELMDMLVCPMLDMLPMVLTPTPMEPTPTCMVSPSDPALVLTPSLRDLSPRGLLMLIPPSSPMEPMDTPMPTPMFHSAPALDWIPSPRVLMPPPRDMPPMPPMDIWDMPMESKSSLRRNQ